MLRKREKTIIRDLKKKMVILSGPRQCGKTTLSQSLNTSKAAYYNWDITEHRKTLLNSKFDPEAELWIFDEIHKNRSWKNWLKGVYDQYHKNHQILVTGSARLELYGRGGDSLQGRYFTHHLGPFTFAEVLNLPDAVDSEIDPLSVKDEPKNQKTIELLLTLSGFPEPFLSGSETEYFRWKLSYGERVVREELRDLENVKDITKVELLSDRLEEVVGSPLSINSLREDLEVSHATVKNWIDIMDRLYWCFRISPFGSSKIKAVKKEQKLYLWDWARVSNAGAKLENLVAVHLQTCIQTQRDIYGKDFELTFVRDERGNEVDFAITHKKKELVYLIEVKSAFEAPSNFFKQVVLKHRPKATFIVYLNGNKEENYYLNEKTTVTILPLRRFLAVLG